MIEINRFAGLSALALAFPARWHRRLQRSLCIRMISRVARSEPAAIARVPISFSVIPAALLPRLLTWQEGIGQLRGLCRAGANHGQRQPHSRIGSKFYDRTVAEPV